MRDKRTVFVIFILPILLYPIMIVGFSQLSILLVGKMEKEAYPIAINSPDSLPELMAAFEADTQLKIVEPENPDSALVKGEILVFLQFPEGFSVRIDEGLRDSISIKFNGAEERSEFALSHVTDIISDFEKKIVTQRVVAAGLDSSVTDPIQAKRENVASKEKMGGMIFGRVLAMIVVLMVISGAYYASIDMVAGEKERGTLETLLVSPAGRMEIVFGKYLTVFVLALINALLNLASMGLSMSVGVQAMGGGLGDFMSLSLDPLTLGLILLQLIPLAALFSAMFLAVSSFAKSYKEAQAYLSPLFIVAELFAMAAILPGIELSTGLALVPILNVSLLIKKFMVGSVGWLNFALTWFSTALFAGITLKWAASILSNEEALLSESGGSPLSRIFARGKKSPHRESLAGAGDALFLYAASIALLFWVGVPLQARDVVEGLIITEVLLVVAPGYILARRLKLDIVKTFRFNKIEPVSALAAIPMAMAGFVLISQLQVLTNMIFPIPPEYTEAFEGMLGDIGSLGTVGGLAVLAILPALCEEFLFRGYILDGLSRRWGAAVGIVVGGVLFGAFHLDPFRLIPASLLGIVFGAIVLRRNSIFYGMIAHAVNNSCAFLLSIFSESLPQEYLSGESFAPIWVILPAAVVFALCLWFIIKPGKAEKPNKAVGS